MEMQEILDKATKEVSKAVDSKKKCAQFYAALHTTNYGKEVIEYGYSVVGYSCRIEKVYRHNGSNKDVSIDIKIFDNYENGRTIELYADRFKAALTDKTIANKIQKAVDFAIALPEKDISRAHTYAFRLGMIGNVAYYNSLVDSGKLDEKCNITAKNEMNMDYNVFLETAGDKPWEIYDSLKARSEAVAKELAARTGAECFPKI